jgi:hypothetical protein
VPALLLNASAIPQPHITVLTQGTPVLQSCTQESASKHIAGRGASDRGELLSIGRRVLSLSLTSPAFRELARGTIPSLSVVKAIHEHLGDGIYAGRK